MPQKNQTCHQKRNHSVVRIANPSSISDNNEDEADTNEEFKDSSEDKFDSEDDLEDSEDSEEHCCKRKRKTTWFHFNLCFGMLGFIVFWSVLMLRIYLPESYWTWSYIW